MKQWLAIIKTLTNCLDVVFAYVLGNSVACWSLFERSSKAYKPQRTLRRCTPPPGLNFVFVWLVSLPLLHGGWTCGIWKGLYRTKAWIFLNAIDPRIPTLWNRFNAFVHQVRPVHQYIRLLYKFFQRRQRLVLHQVMLDRHPIPLFQSLARGWSNENLWSSWWKWLVISSTGGYRWLGRWDAEELTRCKSYNTTRSEERRVGKECA